MLTETDVEKFIDLCNSKSEKHYKNSLNSRKWKNALDFSSSLVAATTSLTMPILAITGSDSITVAVVGNCFVFCNVIISTLKTTYGFVTLEYIHSHLSTEFSDMGNEFRTFQRRSSNVESRYHNDNELEKLIIKFQGICSRSNIQTVKDCHICCCYS